MKYLEKKFSIGGYNPKMACEKCVFKSGKHASWCKTNEALQDKLNDIYNATVDMYRKILYYKV